VNGAASFAQLNVPERVVNGPGEHRIDLAFTRPAGWRLRDGSTLTLDMEVTPAVRRETSWIAASVNGIDLGAQPLRFDADRPQRYSFALPADLLTTTLDGRPIRTLDLTVRLFLDPPEEGCVVVDSRLPLTVVLPQQPNTAEYATALRLIAASGRWADTDSVPAPQLITADRLEERDGRHLILIGSAERNPISAEAIARQPDRLAPLQAVVYRPDDNRQCRLLLISSPWQRDAALLLIDGATPEDLTIGIAAFERRETIERLRGPLALIRTNVPPQSGAGASDVAPPPISLTPQIETPLLERLPGWQIAGAVLLGAFLSALVILLTIQVRRRTRRKTL